MQTFECLLKMFASFTFSETSSCNLQMTKEEVKVKQDCHIDAVIDHLTKRVGDIDSNVLLKSMQIYFSINLSE